jgi:ribosomal protein L40E
LTYFSVKGVDKQMEKHEYCKYCGAANPTGTSFCTKCGKMFASASASPLPPSLTTNEKKSPQWLRIFEISAGLIILILGVAAFYPGVDWGWTTFIAFIAVALIILGIVYIIRIFAKGILGRQFNLSLSVVATLLAVVALATLSPHKYFLTVNLLALGLLFAGIASAARGTVGGKIVGIFGVFVGIIVLIFPNIVGILAIFTGVALIFPNLAYYPESVAALITLSLLIFGLEPIISGIMGRWV